MISGVCLTWLIPLVFWAQSASKRYDRDDRRSVLQIAVQEIVLLVENEIGNSQPCDVVKFAFDLV